MLNRCNRFGYGAFAAAALLGGAAARADPPFSGTIFLDPDIITASDPTTYQGFSDAGRGNREVFDRRTNSFVTINAYLYTTTYADGPNVEFRLNPEFDNIADRQAEVERYARSIGQLPRAVRSDLQSVVIHKGDEAFGGGDTELLIHTGSLAQQYISMGILEETVVHELSHTSLDDDHAFAPGWIAAQGLDPEFISTYARDNPTREDVAESFLPYLMARYRADRITPELAATINATIPNRLAYFDAQNFDLGPFVPEPSSLGLLASAGLLALRRRPGRAR